jgi:hypothetical protein
MQDELIGMLRFDFEFAENLPRKISEVAGYDALAPPVQ